MAVLLCRTCDMIHGFCQVNAKQQQLHRVWPDAVNDYITQLVTNIEVCWFSTDPACADCVLCRMTRRAMQRIYYSNFKRRRVASEPEARLATVHVLCLFLITIVTG